MENAGVKIVKRGEVYLMTMLTGENRFNHTFLDHLEEAFAFLEKYVLSAPFVSIWILCNLLHVWGFENESGTQEY